MPQVLFIQGAGKDAHDHWDNKLVASLQAALGPAFTLFYPQLPKEADPTFAGWSAEIVRQIDQMDAPAHLVGHSIGGAILIHTLLRHPALLLKISGVCLLAAPYLGDGGWPSADISAAPNWNAVRNVAVQLFQGDADQTTPRAHLDLYAKAMPQAQVHVLPGRDHQLNDDLTVVGFHNQPRHVEPHSQTRVSLGGNERLEDRLP